jgi:hypothetical protein
MSAATIVLDVTFDANYMFAFSTVCIYLSIALRPWNFSRVVASCIPCTKLHTNLLHFPSNPLPPLAPAVSEKHCTL